MSLDLAAVAVPSKLVLMRKLLLLNLNLTLTQLLLKMDKLLELLPAQASLPWHFWPSLPQLRSSKNGS